MQEEFNNPKIDEFMAITGCDGVEAQYYLKHNNNNLESALADFFEDPTKAHKDNKKQTMIQQYKDFKEKEEKKSCIIRSIDVRGRQLIEDVKILWKEIVPSVIRGTTPGEEFLIDIGGQMKGLHFLEGTFDQSIKLAFQVQRPLLVLVYTPELKGRLAEILSQQVSNYINDNFMLLGLLSTSEQLQNSLKKQTTSYKPGFNVFRVNFINQVHLMSDFDIKPQTVSADTLSFLRKSIDSIREEQQLESQVKRQTTEHNPTLYENFNQEHNGDLIEPDESGQVFVDYESDRQIKRLQQLQLEQMIKQHQRKKSLQIEQEMKEKLEQEKLQQLQQDRKIRKLSLPEEPRLGQILTVSFKLPMGGRLFRSFEKSDKIDLIFNFIECEDKIQFQNEVTRKFDLLTMNPSKSLASQRDLTISEVFGDETQQVLLVKEL